MSHRDTEDGMGFARLVPTNAEKQRDVMRSELIQIAAACARFQHIYVEELEQSDLNQFGDYANRLKKVADSI